MSLSNEELLEILNAINNGKPVTPLINAGERPFGVIAEMANELLKWRRLYLDQPQDRLYHAKDDTWWARKDDTYLGVGSLFAAEPPKPVVKAYAAKTLLQTLVDVVEEKDSRGEPAIGEDHTGTVNWLLGFGEAAKAVLG